MKLIKDIRLFESDVPNVEGNPFPLHDMGRLYQYDSLACLDVIQRLLFLLRNREFSFGKFDYLFLNFTPCIPHGKVHDSNRYELREAPKCYFVDIGCEVELFNSWKELEKRAFVLAVIKEAVLLKAPADVQQLFVDTFAEVIDKGAKLLIPYRMKENSDYIVEILFRIDEEPDFIPLIRVTGKDGAVVTEHTLRHYDRNEFITQFSTITIGKHFLRITPRKHWYTDFYGVKPIKIEW